MNKLGKEQYIAILENYDFVKSIIYKNGGLERNTTITPEALKWLYENNIITEKEEKSIRANQAYREGLITREECLHVGKNLNIEKVIIKKLSSVLNKFCSGCPFCMGNCGCDDIKLMAAKRRVKVDARKWMFANGAGGSIPYSSNLEIPKVCADDLCKGLCWDFEDFKR